ncbi:MAG: PD-(D/E)XK motif protein [Candidatus Nanopelagicales bacterium]
MANENPWSAIADPDPHSGWNARRVDPSVPWDFFWAKGSDLRPRLILRHREFSEMTLPQLRGLHIEEVSDGADGQILDIVLTEPTGLEVFHHLCLDIVGAAASASSEGSAVSMAIQRTWLWHRMLRGAPSGKLSEEEQKGLIGELLMLEHLFAAVPPSRAVMSWRGPAGAPKDFEVGEVLIECKARRGAATPYVTISSEDQLDSLGAVDLFLFVADLTSASEDQGFSVSEMAVRLGQLVSDVDQAAADLFNGALISAGLLPEHDYSADRWTVQGERSYRVDSAFPRIAASTLPLGIERVHYQVDLNAISPCEVALEAMLEVVKERAAT